MIQTSCPHCGNQLVFQPQHAGREGQCDACNGLLIVPSPQQYAAPGPYASPPPPPPQRPSSPNPDPLNSLADLTNPQPNYQQRGYQQSGYQQPAYQQQQAYDPNYGYDQGGYNQGGNGGYNQGGYNQPNYQSRPYSKGSETNGLGLASFILSLTGFTLIALILGLIAMKKEPKGFAIAGVIISLLSIVIAIVVVIIIFAMAQPVVTAVPHR